MNNVPLGISTSRSTSRSGSRGLASAAILMAILGSAILGSCGGGAPTSQLGASGAKPGLLSVEMGRLVDVYAFQRIDPTLGDRRIRFKRKLVRVAENVLVNPSIETDQLFDAAGEELTTANFEYRPFDKRVGHPELLILWDNRDGPEKARFDAAFASCQSGLQVLAPSFRGQNTMQRPIPVVPRDAAFRLNFSGPISADQEFFAINPSSIQLLEFKGDPNVVQPVDAFRILPYRVIPKGSSILLDTTILGGEGQSGYTSAGLPESTDNVTANIRIAIPSRGQVVSSFYVREDSISNLNGVDSAGRNAVIRDFRSGNLSDGTAAKLPDAEKPMIVASVPMGITAIDTANRIITLNKRLGFVPVRGRYPFVDGPLTTGDLPLGPVNVPVQRALRSGDILTQDLIVDVNGVPETVTVRAEILENLEVGTQVGSSMPIGQTGLSGNEQGQSLTQVRVRVAALDGGLDSAGQAHAFEASSLPQGRDCVLRAFYYEHVPFAGGGSLAVSDAAWRHQFVRIEPQPPTGVPAGTQLAPNSSIAVEFTKPLDLDIVDNTENLVLTNTSILTETFQQQMLNDSKRATARIVPSRLADLTGDGTVLRLQPHMGFFHQNGQTETYAFHVMLGSNGVLDLSGNAIDVFDTRATPPASWSLDVSVAPTAADNFIGWHTWLFREADEDGSLPGSVDIFGQFRLQNGRLFGASGVRFSRTADSQNLGGISRIHRGECWDPTAAPNLALPPSIAPTDNTGATHPGFLYWMPTMYDQVAPPNVPQVYEYWQQLPQDVGVVIEPLNPHGSRMQMRYIEDDFSLDYHQAAEFGLDVDQLYWSPFNDRNVFYDVFDRFSMSLSHSNKRPDEYFYIFQDPNANPPIPPTCVFACDAVSSALSPVFSENVLEGTEQVPVFEDRVYTINPNSAFRSPLQIKYVPFPRFDRSYTWRDSRLVTVDAAGQVIGLGGAQQPAAPAPNDDWTARISSPWVTDAPDPLWQANGGAIWCLDEGDFKGDQRHDHDPVALPLLVDFKIFPDSAVNGIAAGANAFQVALVGPPTNGIPGASGYYDTLGAGCANRPAWPSTRVQASGGEDLITGAAILVDPANTLSAQISILKDAGLGNPTRALFQAPPQDGMLNWAQADFVRKVSTMTFGFFDTLQPQRAKFVNDPTGTPTVTDSDGFPNIAGLPSGQNYRVSDVITQLDPPQGRQPAGTTVVLELRGAELFGNAATLYNPVFAQAGQVADDTFDGRGNLLNPNYACEAYRYSQANHSSGQGGSRDTARVAATGLTRYVTDDKVGDIRDPATGLLPRYLNLRLVMTNNVTVTPALSPSLRSMSIVYRLQPGQ